MPRISKKRLNEDHTSTHSKVITPTSNTLNCTKRKKKLRSIFDGLEDVEKRLLSCNTISRNVKTSSSTDSIIYVGSYTLNDNYSLIDLTESNTSFKSQDSFSVPKYVHSSTNCYKFYKSLVRTSKSTCTASTSRLLDSIEGPKLSLNKNAKSASLIVVNDEHSDIGNSDIPDETHLLDIKRKMYSDQIPELLIEDQGMIKHSLEIEDDINILKLCSPQIIITGGASVKNLMDTYHVVGTGEF